MRRVLLCALPASFLLRCASCSPPETRDAGIVDAGTGSDAGTGADAGLLGAGLFQRMVGLWSGQAGQTPLGSFPILTMDSRAADARVLFARADLDAQNSLRDGFSVEALPAGPTLVYRNGGAFQGVFRDSTTVLVDADEDAGTYHFCAPPTTCLYVDGGCIPRQGGCSFIDALFTFSAPDQLVFNAHVNGAEHLIWTASRKETRPLPSPFPADPAPLAADAPWPPMPQLSATVSWANPLQNPTPVWVLLSTTPCINGGCTPARTIFTTAPAGATSAVVLFDQIHAGAYYGNAVLDLAGTFAMTLTPARGDGICAPDQAVTVPDAGLGTASLSIVYYLP